MLGLRIHAISHKIAHTAKEYGAEVPFMRPKNLSDDFTPTASVLLHALKWLRENEVVPNYVCCIYATAPFVQPDYLMHCRSFFRAVWYKTLIPWRIGKQQKQCMKLRRKEGYYESE